MGTVGLFSPLNRDQKKHANPQTTNTALKHIGFAKQLERTAWKLWLAPWLNEVGFHAGAIEAALAHTGKNEVRAYNRASYIEHRKPARVAK